MSRIIEAFVDAELICQTYDVEFSLSEEYEIAGCLEGKSYQGITTITPSRNRQTLNTNGCVMTQDIVVESIPSNYGLITWNGSVLTVS